MLNFSYVSRIAAALVVAAVATVGGAWLIADQAHAQIDLTGDWEFTVSGIFPDTCQGVIIQTGAEIFSTLECSALGVLTMTGTIDEATGTFATTASVLGVTVELVGTASEDGSSISGTWVADLGLSGTFSGTRLSQTPSIVDISGDWNLLLLGGQVTTCSLSIVQDATGGASLGVAFGGGGSTPPGTGGGGGVGDPPLPPDEPTAPPPPGPLLEPIFPGSEITATLDCGDLGAGPLQGSVSVLDGSFGLRGSFGGKEWSLFGQPSPDVTSLAGTWHFFDSSILTDPTLPPGQTFPPDTTFVAGGTFTTLSTEQVNAGVLVVDCDGSFAGVQGSCLYFMDGSVEFTAQVHVVLPPAGGYSGFDVQMEFVDGIVSLSPPATAAVAVVSPDCGAPDVAATETSVTVACSGSVSSTFIGPVVELTLACAQDGEANLALGSATHFVDGSGATVQPLLFGASVRCFDLTVLPFPFPSDGIGDRSGGNESSPALDQITAPVSGTGPSNGATPLLPFALLGLGVALVTVGGLSLYLRRAR